MFLPSAWRSRLAVRPNRQLRTLPSTADRPTLPLLPVRPALLRSDLPHHLLAQAPRAAAPHLPPAPRLRGLPPNRASPPHLALHRAHPRRSPRPPLPVVPSEPSAPPARTLRRARQLHQLRVQPVLPHRLPPRHRLPLALLLWLHRFRAAPQRRHDPGPKAPPRRARGPTWPPRSALDGNPSCRPLQPLGSPTPGARAPFRRTSRLPARPATPPSASPHPPGHLLPRPADPSQPALPRQ